MSFANALFALASSDRCAVCRRHRPPLCTLCGEGVRPALPVGPLGEVDRSLAALEYDGPARALVLALKLSGRREAAEPLVDAMWRTVVARGLRGSVLTWVPARRQDVRRRGFDHAELLARGVARRTGLAARRILVRAGPAVDQAGLTRAERHANLAGAFAAYEVSERVVLVDDLVTTGATAAACAGALRAAGATGVELIVACRTP